MLRIKGFVASILICLTTTLFAATNTFIVKSFAVANININPGTDNLVGVASMFDTNSPFSIISNATFNVASGQTQNVYVAFNTSKVGRYTNYVIFVSNGGNSTNMVFGTITPDKPANFRILSTQ